LLTFFDQRFPIGTIKQSIYNSVTFSLPNILMVYVIHVGITY